MSTALAKRLSYFQESAFGTPPANAAAWVSSGQSIRFIPDSLDPSSLVQTTMQDERSQTSVLAEEMEILGMRTDTEFSFDTYLTGSGDTTQVSGTQPSLSALMTLAEHAMGGLRRATAQTISTGATSTSIPCVAVTGLAVGDWVGFADSNGLVHGRQITAITSTTLTLHAALPFSPANSSLVHGLAHAYIDESRLVDSGLGPYTFSWLMEIGLSGSTEMWEAAGCVSTLSGMSIERNAPPKLSWQTMVGNFRTPEINLAPSWSATPAGEAGVAVGPNTEYLFADFGSTTTSSLHVSAVEINPGLQRSAIPTMTSATAAVPGRYGYTLARNPCEVTLTVVPHSDTRFTEFGAGTLKHLQIERRGSTGVGWAVYFPRLQVSPTPKFAVNENYRAQQFRLKALPNTNAAGTAPINSRMCLVFY